MDQDGILTRSTSERVIFQTVGTVSRISQGKGGRIALASWWNEDKTRLLGRSKSWKIKSVGSTEGELAKLCFDSVLLKKSGDQVLLLPPTSNPALLSRARHLPGSAFQER